MGVWCSPNTSLPVSKCIIPMLNSLSLGWCYIIFWEIFTKWVVRLFTWGLSSLVIFIIYSLIMTSFWRSEYRPKNLNTKGKFQIYKSLPPQNIPQLQLIYWLLVICLCQYFIAVGILLLALALCFACSRHFLEICSFTYFVTIKSQQIQVFVCFVYSGEKNNERYRVQWNSIFSILKTLDWKFWVCLHGESAKMCDQFYFFRKCSLVIN